MSPAEPEIRGVAAAVTRTIPLARLELPDEFFPAHLSVALIDAVFRSRPGRRDQAEECAARYCRHFGITRARARKMKTPSVIKQETLGDLIGHYDEHGVDRMKNEVFQARQRLPGTRNSRAEFILHAAKSLRHIGVDVLQDIAALLSEEIEEALHSGSDIDDYIARKLVMYTGDDDYVRGDVYVRRFVADAIGQKSVSAARARSLVRRSAYELILSPRYLYLEIRRYCLSREDGARAHGFGDSSPEADVSRSGTKSDDRAGSPA
jgi:hypothetical protein